MNRAGVLVLLVAMACAREQPSSGSRAGPEEPPPERLPSAETRWVQAKEPTDATLLEAPAEVVAGPEGEGRVSPLFEARIGRVLVRAGDLVEAGQPVAEVIAPELLAAAAAYLGSTAQLEVHRRRRAELEELRREKIVESRQVFESAARVAELEAEQARSLAVLQSAGIAPASAHAVLKRGTIVLSAPIRGVVRAVNARPGEVRSAGGEPIARIIGEGPFRVEARFVQRPPADATFRFEAIDGTVHALRAPPQSMILEPESGTVIGWFGVEESVALSNGLRGIVRVSTANLEALEIPAQALRTGPTASVVFRRRQDRVDAVPVIVLATSGATALVRPRDDAGDLVSGDEIAADAARVGGSSRGEPSR